MKQALPWVLVALLAAGAAALHFHYRGALDAKTAELEVAKENYAKLEASTATALADANSRLTASQTKLVEFASEATKKVQEIAAQAEERTQALAAEANEKIRTANLPEVAVLVGFRKALLSSGNVAGIKSTSSSSAPISVTAARPSTGQSRNYQFVIDANGVKEVGEQQGWAFVKGDTLKVEQPGHKPKTWVFN